MSFCKALIPLWVATLLGAPAAVAQSAAAATPAHGQTYVALGDSLAAGYQPGAGDQRAGGYAAGVLHALRKKAPETRLKNFGCNGESTTTMMAGGKCDYGKAPDQLSAAKAFLRQNRGRVSLITLDIGANDVDQCAMHGAIDAPCVHSGMAAVSTNLPRILAGVRAAAPDAKIVVANYYNPFLAAWSHGSSGRAIAKQSVPLQKKLNDTIDHAAKNAGAAVADVAATFASSDFSATDRTTFGDLPRSVARICTWTWMCKLNNIHPNDAGYAKMANAFVAALHRPAPTPSARGATPDTSSAPARPPSSPAAGPGVASSGAPSSPWEASSPGIALGSPDAAAGRRSSGHDGMLWGAGILGGIVAAFGGVAAWRSKRG